MQLAKQVHDRPVADVAEYAGVDPARGLEEDEVARRLARDGPNRLTPPRRRGPLVRFLFQFHQPLIYVLIAAALIAAAFQEWIDASVIAAVVLLNALVGFVQESRALQAIDALARSVPQFATVRRAGGRREVQTSELVVGDVVLLFAGDRVPADLRLVEATELRVDESVLTGESLPVDKGTGPLPAETVLAERRNLAFASTNVTVGAGVGIVTATGDDTQVGEISRTMREAEQLDTPLTVQMKRFSVVLTWAILAAAAATFAVGLAHGLALFDTILASIALIVAAIPEGLPAAITIALARGVHTMARRRAIVRTLPAVETLGSTTVICSDKTGTLTENEMTVTHAVTAGGAFSFTGAGYAPEGQILDEDGSPVVLDEQQALSRCLRAALLCNDAQVRESADGWELQGDPTEGALVVAALKAGLDETVRERMPRLGALPFDSRYRYMATAHELDGRAIVYVKGAAEAVAELCSAQLGGDGSTASLDRALVAEQAQEMARNGLRVLACAELRDGAANGATVDRDALRGATLLGLLAMVDPPRPESRPSIEQCASAGIAVKMITGDHPVTAASIAREVGLGNGEPESVVTGAELERLDGDELRRVAAGHDVFARVSPTQKLRLVEALQAHDQVVAMTGDGVNDAPALRRANIGVAMGRVGTDVAREASDVVLTDDNFATIVAAVEVGRNVFDNIRKFVVFVLPTNIGQSLVVMSAILLGITLPISPVQILWANLVTAVLLGLGLAFEVPEPGLMDLPPRRLGAPIVTRHLVIRMVLVGLLLLGAVYALFEWSLAQGGTTEQARTAAVNALMAAQAAYLLNCRALRVPMREIGFFSNPWIPVGIGLVALAQLAFTYLPPMQLLFGTASIPAAWWLAIFAAGAAVLAVVSLEKRLYSGPQD